jgi:hypothetical protein
MERTSDDGHVTPSGPGAIPMQLFDSFLQVQRVQLEVAAMWQASWAAVVEELFDEWACRFGGGVPIDG